MGEVIRKDAADDAIEADGITTLANADAKGGVWKKLADERLRPIVLVSTKIVADIKQTEDALLPLKADLDMFDDLTDDFLKEMADTMWNQIGRPAFDATYSIIWPGGASVYTDGKDAEQPDRMEFLAGLIETILHPKLDPAWAAVTAGQVRDRAKVYRTKVEAWSSVNTKLTLLEKMRAAVARVVQMELARLKRRCLAEGLGEAEIHQVIPDRPRLKGAKPGALPT